MRYQSMRRILVLVGAWLTVSAYLPLTYADEVKQDEAQPTPILSIDDVKVGMKGYGKTVFHGSQIEPFNIEVVSVISDSSAKRGTIWVVCPDERMAKSGPVQGMSGSPMYLWDEGEEGSLGEGGRLIGAFAFGYSGVNVCLVGVQPIEYMREVGGRAIAEDLDEIQAHRVPPGTMQRSLSTLQAVADQSDTTRHGRFGLDTVQHLLEQAPRLKTRSSLSRLADTPTAAARPLGMSSTSDPNVYPFNLPMAVGDAQIAALIGPLLQPAGIAVMSSPVTSVAGKAPSNVDPATVKLEPGSVLSIPLAFGDLDLNAAGTVTDVLPDGTVLGFGHAMNAVGSSRMPMATGYTHFVVSRQPISFKLASSLDIVGSIVRDEASAVAGVDDMAYVASPVAVKVALPSQPVRDYSYQVVDDFLITPNILAAVTAGSLTAVQAPPVLHTMHTTGTLTFTGGRTFNLDSLLAGQGMNGLFFDMLPPITAMMQNPFEPLKLESADLSIVVEEGINVASMVSATLDQRLVKPGDTVSISLLLQPFDGPAFSRTLPFTLPTDLAEGEYQLLISDAGSYGYRMTAANPQLSDIDDVDTLLEALQTLADVDRQTIYVGLPLQTMGVAVGGQPMSDLPSSRAMVLGSTASSTTMPYPRFVEQAFTADQLIEGEIVLPLQVVVGQP
ncbi:MAG: hypothetical protein AAF086_08515 [Planctomycetota bacterium]